MRAPFTRLYAHLVWATWDRLPLITTTMREPLAAAMIAKCRALGATAIAVALVPDHVHLLVRLPTTLAIADLVKEVKGSSSHLTTHAIAQGVPFKWQGAYGAFTVSHEDVPEVKAYILDQERHHQEGTLVAAWEKAEETSTPGG